MERAPVLPILFVCTYNVNRSPAAEIIMNQESERSGVQVCARSAGVRSARFMSMSQDMSEALKKLGYEVPVNKPVRKLTDSDLEEARLVFPMDEDNLQALIRNNPFSSHKIYDPVCFTKSWREVHDPLKQYEERDDLVTNILPRIVRNRLLKRYHPQDTKYLVNDVYIPVAQNIQRAIRLTLTHIIGNPSFKNYLI